MPQLLLALLVLWGLLYGIRLFARTSPAVIAKVVKRGGGALSLIGAGLLLLRGRIDIALGLGGLGVWLLGWAAGPGFYGFRWPGAGAGRTPGRSRVRSAMIEMELDHASGAMQGTVLAGALEGQKLAALTRPQCEALYRVCLRDDPEGARLLEAYLDRRFAGWRAAGQGYEDAGAGNVRRGTAAMSEDEAYEVLGLQRGASREDVARAHRTLMKKLHPDHGGSTSLAARVNEAKDILMRRHT